MSLSLQFWKYETTKKINSLIRIIITNHQKNIIEKSALALLSNNTVYHIQNLTGCCCCSIDQTISNQKHTHTHTIITTLHACYTHTISNFHPNIQNIMLKKQTSNEQKARARFWSTWLIIDISRNKKIASFLSLILYNFI